MIKEDYTGRYLKRLKPHAALRGGVDNIVKIKKHYIEEESEYLHIWNVTKNQDGNPALPLYRLESLIRNGELKWYTIEPIKRIKKHSFGNIGRENELVTQ